MILYHGSHLAIPKPDILHSRPYVDFFYKSELYQLISQGISDMHCRSDLYLIDELEDEYKAYQRK